MNPFRRNTQPEAPSLPQGPARGAAISLEKVQQSAPGLVNLYKQAGVSLAKYGVSGERAAVYLVLDHSPSMDGYYDQGDVQGLAERVLAFAAHFDDDGVVPVEFFDRSAEPIKELALANYRGKIQQLRRGCSSNGTDYAPAMRAVINHYISSGTSTPAYVAFQTDGQTRDEGAVTAILREASKLSIFWQFIGFGDPSSAEFDFLKRLDKLRGRAVDNAGFFAAGLNPAAMPDGELYDRLMVEYPSWLAAARAKGIAR